jgi:hypothetical protein
MNEATHSIKATNPVVDHEALFPPSTLLARHMLAAKPGFPNCNIP